MARRKSKNKGLLIGFLFAAIAIIAGFSRGNFTDTDRNLTLDENSMAVYFVDVGQGSCTVIQDGSKAVLIDSGLKSEAKQVLDFLEDKGIKELSCAIITHPDSDHSGGMSTIVKKFQTDKVIMPYIKDEYLPTTNTFLSLLSAIDEENIKLSALKKNTEISFGKGTINILVPTTQTDDMNNMSLLVKFSYGKENVLIVGDAEKEEMYQIMKANGSFDFSSEIMLLGHHGSRTSLNKTFLNKVGFTYGIISCGKDNSYNHPHKEVTDYLNQNNISYYRTDEVGTVSIITNGKTLNITTQKGES